jgi:hypothetical protein
MIHRRTAGTAAVFALALAFAPSLTVEASAQTKSAQTNANPAAPITAIYKHIVASYNPKTKDIENGYFVTQAKARHRWLTRSFAALWDKADALTAPGDAGEPGYDPITDSQDPMVRDPRVTTDTIAGDTARVTATFLSHDNARVVVHYTMMREDGAWKIDEIVNAHDGRDWSVRKNIAYYIEGFHDGDWTPPPRTSPNYQEQ